MKILYISSVSSEHLINQIFNKNGENPGFAVQKFNRLLVKGFLNNSVEIVALSNPPITSSFTSSRCIKLRNEIENDINYNYIPYLNFILIKQICIFLYTLVYVFIWGFRKRKNKVIICDVLNISASLGAIIASKVNGITSVGIVTDIFSQLIGAEKKGIFTIIKRIANFINKSYISSFSKYILLTEAMNEIVNPKCRPNIVMEGLCDRNVTDEQILKAKKKECKTVLYAGGIEKEYGIKMLIDGFKIIDNDNIQLLIFGNGTYLSDLINDINEDPRIKYCGVVSNNEVINHELSVSLLVNPRLSCGTFTNYSFPSKNIEYMVSGTPLLTTKLPGIPVEYYPYVYFFEDESIDGFSKSIEKVLNFTQRELDEFGKKARDFVLHNKNNEVQAKRIINFIKNPD